MKEFYAGHVNLANRYNFDYYTDDFETFYNVDDTKLSEKDLEDWAYWLNNSWSQDNEMYEIKLNCKDAYTEMDKNKPIWKCKFHIVGAELTTSSVFGYGNTEVEALEHCKKIFQMLQERYSEEDECF